MAVAGPASPTQVYGYFGTNSVVYSLTVKIDFA